MIFKKTIPTDIRQRVEQAVAQFNERHFRGTDMKYIVRFKGRCAYLDFFNEHHAGPICRLTYTGDFEDWEFAIFKYSDERYDSGEWFFPGSEEVDGTIEGAMRAGLEAYPP